MKKSRQAFYLDENKLKKLEEISIYLANSKGVLLKGSRNKSEIMGIIIETFYGLFITEGEGRSYHENLFHLEKNEPSLNDRIQFKAMSKRLDQLLYLELLHYHLATKGKDFDIQNLESIHSSLDVEQHELLLHIDSLIKKDAAYGQTVKHSH
ncbi:hypothetical protein ACXM1Q_005515 [Streptococcus sp. 10F2]